MGREGEGMSLALGIKWPGHEADHSVKLAQGLSSFSYFVVSIMLALVGSFFPLASICLGKCAQALAFKRSGMSFIIFALYLKQAKI
jgi:CHASE2 domain-containing sensor protein